MERQKKNLRWTRPLAILVAFLPLFANAAESIDFGRYWMQDRFIRAMAYTMGQDPEDQLKILEKALSAVEVMSGLPSETHEVANLQEFEVIREKYFRSNGSLEADVKAVYEGRVPRRLKVTSSDPGVQQEIDRIVAAYAQHLDREFTFPPKLWWTSVLNSLAIKNFRQVGFFDLLFENSKDSALLLKGLRQMAPAHKLEKIAQFSAQIEGHLAAIDQVAERAMGGDQVKFPNPVMEKAARLVLQEYFSGLSTNEKLELAFAVLDRPEDLSALGVFKRVSRRAGPQFKKFFQVIGRDPGFAPELQAIFISFEDDLPAAPKEAVEKARRALLAHGRYIKVEMEMEPRKVGTMAQVHSARVTYANGTIRQVAVRILKPGIREELERENRALDRIIAKLMAEPDIREHMSSLPKLIEDMKEIARRETVLDITIDAQEKAFKSYSRSIPLTKADGTTVQVVIRVPEVDAKINNDVMVMEWLEGQSLDKIRQAHPEMLTIAAEAWVRTWIETALFGDGFVHSDPHPGNVRFRMVSDTVIEPLIYDYGMTGQVNPELQKRFALLAITNYGQSDGVMARVLLDLSVASGEISAEELGQKITQERARLAGQGRHEVNLEHWIGFSIKNGLAFPEDITSLARGLTTSLRVLRESGSPKTMGVLVREITMARPHEHMAKFFDMPSLISATDLAKLVGGGLLPRAFDTLAKNGFDAIGGQDLLNKGTELVRSVDLTSKLKGWGLGFRKSLEDKFGPARCGAVFH